MRINFKTSLKKWAEFGFIKGKETESYNFIDVNIGGERQSFWNYIQCPYEQSLTLTKIVHQCTRQRSSRKTEKNPQNDTQPWVSPLRRNKGDRGTSRTQHSPFSKGCEGTFCRNARWIWLHKVLIAGAIAACKLIVIVERNWIRVDKREGARLWFQLALEQTAHRSRTGGNAWMTPDIVYP